MSTAIERMRALLSEAEGYGLGTDEAFLKMGEAVSYAAIAQAEAAERQAAAAEKANELAEQRNAKLERIAVIAEWYQKWRDWDGEAEDLNFIHADADQQDEDRRQRNADIDAELAARNR